MRKWIIVLIVTVIIALSIDSASATYAAFQARDYNSIKYMKKDKLKSGENIKVKKVKNWKGTYYVANSGSMGSRGASGNKLISGKDIALSSYARKKYGIKYGQIVRVIVSKSDKNYKKSKVFTRYYRVSDTGCRGKIIDIVLSHSAAKATGIRRYGVFKARMVIPKNKVAKTLYKKRWKKQKKL